MKLRYKRPFFNWLAQLFQKVSGVPPLAMPRAAAGGLKEVTAYGGCALNGIPSEYTEVTYVKNAANTLVKTGVVIGNDDTFKIDIKASVVQGSFYLFQSRDIVATVGSNSSTITGISGSSTGQTIIGSPGVLGSSLVSAITRPLGSVSHGLRIIFTCTDGNASFYVKDLDTGEEDTVSEPYDASQLTRGSTEMCLYGNNGTTVGSAATPNRLARDCSVYYAKLWKNGLLVLDLVPVKRNTDNAAGFYNRVNGAFLTASEGSLTTGAAVTPSPDSPCEIWCNNGKLLPYLNAEGSSTQDGTPSPDNPVEIRNYTQGNMVLRGVSDTVKDSYNASSISILRKVGVLILTGAEDWIIQSNGTYPYFRINFNSNFSQSTTIVGGLCSHFECLDIGLATNNQGIALWKYSNTNKTSLGLRFNSLFPATNANIPYLKSWLAQQYQNGTPVTIYYPLTTETTETWNDVVYTEGTRETITVGNSSASAEYLLKTTSYGRTFTDQHSLVHGSILRSCQILVVTGQENIVYVDSPTTQVSRFRLSQSDMYYKSEVTYGSPRLTSHFESKIASVYGACYSFRTNIMFLWTYGATAQEFKAWLADQYAAGTPVIVIYPLATPVTEQVAPQALDTVAGTNALEITQASLSGLELTAEYKRR